MMKDEKEKEKEKKRRKRKRDRDGKTVRPNPGPYFTPVRFVSQHRRPAVWIKSRWPHTCSLPQIAAKGDSMWSAKMASY